jgi:hypothetical protein
MQSYIEFLEWKELFLQAKKLGLSVAEIREWLVKTK